MNKIKTENKYLALFTILLAIISFIFFLAASVLYEYIDNLGLKVLFLLILAMIFAFVLSYGISILSSTVKDAMITLRRMLRVENLSNPLLLKLAEEAPGTYHHSMNVGSIAQNAAKAIGANSLLVRVASYYHDIGKLENPLNFIENQGHKEIPQDENAQYIRRLSNEIISHVPEGVKIAHKNGLPDEIVDLISQHHGTSRVLYCFEKAKERGLKIKKTDFRYSGPIPQTKESVILMLSDIVEAAVRASEDLSNNAIVEIVDSAISDKTDDKQIKGSIVTDAEIARIRASLIKSLSAIYHQRIRYNQNED